MAVYGPQELLADVHSTLLCVNCGACINLCPYFKSYRGKTSMLFPCTSDEGRCHAYCPKTEVDLDALSVARYKHPYDGRPLGDFRKILMARRRKSLTHGTCQDGGTTTALMTYALERGFVDAAVLTGSEEMLPVPRIVTNPGEVSGCATSKYVTAPTLAGLNQAIQGGYQRIGVVGTPCQLTAVAQMRTNHAQKTDPIDPPALTIGLFCTWALEPRSLLALLKKQTDLKRITKITIPPPPAEVLVVNTDRDRFEIPLSEIRSHVPEGCHICPDMTGEWSDLSIGAMEGEAGWNTLIIRSDNGERLVEAAANDGYLDIREMPTENQNRLETAAAAKKRRALRKAREDGLLNTPNDGRHAALRLTPETVTRLVENQ